MTISYYLRRSDKGAQGYAPIYLRISHRGAQKYVSLGMKVLASKWDPGRQELYLFMRQGGSARATWGMWKWDPSNDEYGSQVTVADGQATSTDWGLYPHGPMFDEDGALHVFFIWRESGKEDQQELFYMKRTASGDWEHADGTSYSLPVTRSSTRDVAKPFVAGDGVVSFGGTAVDSGGNPHVAVVAFDDQDDRHGIWEVHWDGSAWQDQLVYAGMDHMRTGGISGDQSYELSRPLYVIDKNDDAYILFRSAWLGNGLYCASVGGDAWDEWRLNTVIESPLGAYHPTHDPERWRQDGVLA